MKLILTGNYTQSTYAWNEQGHYVGGTISVPMRVTITQQDGYVYFKVWDYDPIDVGSNPQQHLKKHMGKFVFNSKPAVTIHKDNSDGTWKSITWTGEYVDWAARLCELRVSQAQYGDRLTDVHVAWPHKNSGFRSEMVLLYLDAKSQQKLDELFNSLGERDWQS